MIGTRRVLATIPARGGSKRFPGKNLALLEGRSLLAYSVEAAFGCEAVDRVVVSTEDDAINRAAQECGAEVINRPPDLATDDAELGPVCRHALLEAENRDQCCYDVHVLLQPTSPLRTSEHINLGLQLLDDSECDSILSVRSCSEDPYVARVVKDGVLHPFLPITDSDLQHKQDLPRVYYPNGALYITYRSVLLRTHHVLGSRTVPLLMTIEDSVDIDREFDMSVANLMLRRRLESNL